MAEIKFLYISRLSNPETKKLHTMQYKKNQMSVGLMIQRCHRWRQKRKQYIDAARGVADNIERERILQMAEHYGRIVSYEQGKIDSSRDPREKVQNNHNAEIESNDDEDDDAFPDFMEQIKTNH